jgi:hypothetical protein
LGKFRKAGLARIEMEMEHGRRAGRWKEGGFAGSDKVGELIQKSKGKKGQEQNKLCHSSAELQQTGQQLKREASGKSYGIIRFRRPCVEDIPAWPQFGAGGGQNGGRCGTRDKIWDSPTGIRKQIEKNMSTVTYPLSTRSDNAQTYMAMQEQETSGQNDC